VFGIVLGDLQGRKGRLIVLDSSAKFDFFFFRNSKFELSDVFCSFSRFLLEEVARTRNTLKEIFLEDEGDGDLHCDFVILIFFKAAGVKDLCATVYRVSSKFDWQSDHDSDSLKVVVKGRTVA
jgi:hypothetical protein